MSAELELTKEMMEEAAAAEEQELSQAPGVLFAQNHHLNNRVVILRALVNHQKKELDALRAKLANNENENANTKEVF